MWLRRAFYLWLLPAAFVLPLWLLVGWGVFQAGAWVFLWVLFMAVPSVLLGQLALAALVRSRPTVRADRALSWGDVLGFALWHALTIMVGFFDSSLFVPTLLCAILVFVGLLWLSLRQLWNEARASGSRIMLRYGSVGLPTDVGASGAARAADAPAGVIVVNETSATGERRRP